MHHKCTVTLVAIALLGGSGCASTGTGLEGNEKTVLGSVVGATAGGLIAAGAGGNTAATIGGVLVGGLLGGALGNYLDQRDQEIANQDAQRALESARSGTTSQWQNPDSGHSGTFTPTRTYQTETGRYCREYTQTVVVGGEEQEAYGTACRQPDGSWQIQK